MTLASATNPILTATASPVPIAPGGAQTMKAVVQDRYGSADVLEVRDIARPVCGPDDVLVHVHAAGVDRGAWHLMTGLPYLIRLVGYGFRAPKNPVLGMDVAGHVEAVGANVTQFHTGDEVFGIGNGSFAEFACVPQTKLARKPVNLSFEQAAAVPTSAGTALQGLRDIGEVKAGQTVLIIGAGGGVGSFAVQIAKALGAEVTGVEGPTKLDLVRSIGADHVIDYKREDFSRMGKRYDVILDIAGNRSLSDLRRALTPRGTLVITGGENGDRWIGGVDRQLRALALSPFVGQRLRSFIAEESSESIRDVTTLIEAGKVMPVIDKTFPLSETADAMRYLTDSHVRGKLVITV
ncbi:MAG: NADPH:quinone reductase-like Zn-dependent oxidoreductase [Planctomycetota bacterium]|jgi:NADPH:quinone reductase-like Zn-dependent oxidoreductase